VAQLKAHVVQHIEAGIAKVRGLKRTHTKPGSDSSKEHWAILQAKQALYKLNFTVLEMIRRKENLKKGERLALATKGLLRPEIDEIMMVMPMRPLVEEMLNLSGWTQECGVAAGPAGQFEMTGARTFRLCVTCDGAQLTKGNKGFIILCYKLLEPEIISAFTDLGGGSGGIQNSIALAGQAIREVRACEGVPFVDSRTGLAINVVPTFPADMSCHWKMSSMGGPSHGTGLFCIYCLCHNTHRGVKALWHCTDCLRLDPAEKYVCHHHALHDSKELIAHDSLERAMRTAQENEDAQWRVTETKTAEAAAADAIAAASAAASAAPAWWRVDAGTILHQPAALGVRKEPLMAFLVDTLKLASNADHKAVAELKLPELKWFDKNTVHPKNVETVSDTIVAEQLRA
ncbi:hypothetical protein B484DRAFT_407230, partial [Ochromonadaceae sp. CCMP2298]